MVQLTFRRAEELTMPNPDLDDLLPSWRIYLDSKRRSPATVRLYVTGVETYLDWYIADRRPAGEPPALDRKSLDAFVVHLLDLGRAPATALVYAKGVKLFAKWLTEEGELPVNPLLGFTPLTLDTPVVPGLSDDQLRALVKACAGPGLLDRRDEAVARLMAETGLRIGEAAALTVQDVDVVAGMAAVRRGKGGTGRLVSFGPQTGMALDRYLRMRRRHPRAQEPPLWLGHGGKLVGTTGLRRALERRARAAGIEGFHPHVLRHTAATRWLDRGGSEGGALANFGWKRRDMLDRYVAATAMDRAAAEARGLGLGDL
jgi:integrase